MCIFVKNMNNDPPKSNIKYKPTMFNDSFKWKLISALIKETKRIKKPT